MAIDWARVDPACLPDGSPVRLALEQGEYHVAAWLVREIGGARVYVQSEASHLRFVSAGHCRRASGSSRPS